MQTAAAIVIGAGAFGASTAYHLARRGADVVLVDQHAIGSQTSARVAGLPSNAASTPVMAALRHEPCEAFGRFASELGRSVDFHRCRPVQRYGLSLATRVTRLHLSSLIEPACTLISARPRQVSPRTRVTASRSNDFAALSGHPSIHAGGGRADRTCR